MEDKGLTRELTCIRAAKEITEGMYVNLGIGMPLQVANFIPDDVEVFLQSENGVLGYGRVAEDEEEWDVDLVNAGGQPVVLRENSGPCFFGSLESFTMIRGDHLDLVILGALEVSERGDIANWARDRKGVGGIGGAMDLACGGAKRLIALMEHTTKDGRPKVVRKCALPLTAPCAVDRIITDLAVIDITPEGPVLKEVAPGVSPEDVQAATEPVLIRDPGLKEMTF
jgi:3-oxoacid CoA-transferase subunit B